MLMLYPLGDIYPRNVRGGKWKNSKTVKVGLEPKQLSKLYVAFQLMCPAFCSKANSNWKTTINNPMNQKFCLFKPQLQLDVGGSERQDRMDKDCLTMTL